MKQFFKRYKLDIIIVIILLIVGLTSTIFSLALTKKGDLYAKIYSQNEIILEIDLSKENEPRLIQIETYHEPMQIEVKKNAIRVANSSCPHLDCVHMGYVNKSNTPIVCVYNKVVIEIVAINNPADIEV